MISNLCLEFSWTTPWFINYVLGVLVGGPCIRAKFTICAMFSSHCKWVDVEKFIHVTFQFDDWLLAFARMHISHFTLLPSCQVWSQVPPLCLRASIWYIMCIVRYFILQFCQISQHDKLSALLSFLFSFGTGHCYPASLYHYYFWPTRFFMNLSPHCCWFASCLAASYLTENCGGKQKIECAAFFLFVCVCLCMSNNEPLIIEIIQSYLS